MKKLIEKLEWICDYYLVYFLYNTRKIGRYHQYMRDKWGLETEGVIDFEDQYVEEDFMMNEINQIRNMEMSQME